jgi:SAM-dependent methyltransferase
MRSRFGEPATGWAPILTRVRPPSQEEDRHMHNDRYQEEYTADFVSRWDELIGWDGRREGEGRFFEDLLHGNGCKRIADIASGTGYHAVTLAEAGFEVIATDGSAEMIDQTRRNASRRGTRLAGSEVADWRGLDEPFGEEAFDAVLCLGNAFTHLFEHAARLQALRAMHRVLRPGGLLVLDHRNYDRLLDEGYSSKHRHYYTGDGVEAHPVEISEKIVRFEYRYPDDRTFHLNMFPLRRTYMLRVLKQAGFDHVESFGDFVKLNGQPDVDFIQHVARKDSH